MGIYGHGLDAATCGVFPTQLHVGATPAGHVLQAIRSLGPVTRDFLVTECEMSAATLNRNVNLLVDLGILIERVDLIAAGAIGRPKIPLTLDRDRFCIIGIHIGARYTSISLSDLAGRIIETVGMETSNAAEVAPTMAIADIVGAAQALVAKFPSRQALWLGVAIGGKVDQQRGIVDHKPLGWKAIPLGKLVAEVVKIPVSVSSHVEAMAAAEVLLGSTRAAAKGTSLYFYVRETVGIAVTINGALHLGSGGGTVTNLPVTAPRISNSTSTTLGEIIGAQAITDAAARLGISDDTDSLFTERACALGQAVALVRDIVNPDEIIVAGLGFAEHPQGLAPVQQAFNETTQLRMLELEPTRFGNQVQHFSAMVVGLAPIYADPIGALQTVESLVSKAKYHD